MKDGKRTGGPIPKIKGTKPKPNPRGPFKAKKARIATTIPQAVQEAIRTIREHMNRDKRE